MHNPKRPLVRAAAGSGMAAAALGASLLLAGAASASAHVTPSTTGPTIATTNAAGYQASGRDFRYISSTITIPDDSFASLYGGLYPAEYIQLSNGSLNEWQTPSGDEYVRAGIETCQVAQTASSSLVCPSTNEWVVFVEYFNNSLNGPFMAHYLPLPNVQQGDGVNFSIYYDQGGNELHFTITPPSTDGPEQFYKTQAYGPVFDHAAALNDFLNSSGNAPIGLPPFVEPFQVNSFLQGALTTYSGAKGSFVGPWATSEVEATSNGLPYPSGTVRANPHALYGDGLPANGAVRGSDAFDEYAR